MKAKLLLPYVLLAVILFGALLVRLYKINSPVADWHSWRQADTASVSKNFYENGIDLLYPRYQDISHVQTGYFNPNGLRFVEYPIYNILHVVAFRLTSSFISFDAAGRLVSAMIGVAATAAMFLLGRRFGGKSVGLLSSFFYAFIPFNIYFTRVILPEPLGVLFAILGLYFFLIYFEKESKGQLLLGSAFFALSLLIKPFLIFYAVPLLYVAIKKYGIKGIFKRIDLFVALDIVLIPFLLWRIWMNLPSNLIGIPHFGWAFNGDNIRFRPSFWNWIFAERIGRMILGIWGVAVFSYGVFVSFKKNINAVFLLLGMFLYLSLIATANVRHDYYQTLIIPVIAILWSIGFVSIWNSNLSTRFGKIIVLGFTTFMMFLVGTYQIKDFYKINHPEIIAAGEAVNKLTDKDSRVIAPYNGDTAFLYQTGRWGWPIIDRSIDELINLGATHYVSVNFDSDTNILMKRFKTILRNDRFIILDLREENQQ